MERYTSTFATTAACLGLFVAGHLAMVQARPALPDMDAIRAQHVARITAAVSAASARPEDVRAWATPPVRSETAAAEAVSAPVQAAEPAPAAAEPALAPVPVQPASLRPDKGRRASEQAQRRRIAKARKTQVAARGLATEETTARPDPAAPAPAKAVDPIGDLLKGLGIGRES